MIHSSRAPRPRNQAQAQNSRGEIDVANIASGFGSVHSMAPLHAKWGWIVALGIVYVVAGFIALGSVVMATAAAVWVVGIMMIIAGVTEVISAFQVKTWGRFFFWLLLG